jgi:LPXTG-site transpeptidase (sortase) family protein
LAAIEVSTAELATYSAPTPADLALPGARATRIRIPTIGVDAVINELKILLLNSSLAWETPNQVVGHIPTTAAAGAQGEGWYFGHLESPLKGEGNVFARLPEITKLAGDAPVYIFLETPDRHYAYQVYVTVVVYQDDLSLTDSGKYDITLVTCTPRLYYDHRLLVTAALVGVKEA